MILYTIQWKYLHGHLVPVRVFPAPKSEEVPIMKHMVRWTGTLTEDHMNFSPGCAWRRTAKSGNRP